MLCVLCVSAVEDGNESFNRRDAENAKKAQRFILLVDDRHGTSVLKLVAARHRTQTITIRDLLIGNQIRSPSSVLTTVLATVIPL